MAANIEVKQGTSAPANLLVRFFQSSLGKKYVVAVTGFLLFVFVVMHMLGNLQIFLGPNRPVLGFQGKCPGKSGGEHDANRHHRQQRGAVQTLVISPGEVQVD